MEISYSICLKNIILTLADSVSHFKPKIYLFFVVFIDILERCREDVSRCSCTLSSMTSAMTSRLPIINVIKSYNLKRDLPGEVIAGITVAIMHIPQGMNYTVRGHKNVNFK